MRLFQFPLCTKPLTYGLGIMPGAEQEFGGAVPEGHDDGVEVGERLEGRVEEAREPHVRDLDATPLLALAHHQDVGRFLKHGN